MNCSVKLKTSILKIIDVVSLVLCYGLSPTEELSDWLIVVQKVSRVFVSIAMHIMSVVSSFKWVLTVDGMSIGGQIVVERNRCLKDATDTMDGDVWQLRNCW